MYNRSLRAKFTRKVNKIRPGITVKLYEDQVDFFKKAEYKKITFVQIIKKYRAESDRFNREKVGLVYKLLVNIGKKEHEIKMKTGR